MPKRSVVLPLSALLLLLLEAPGSAQPSATGNPEADRRLEEGARLFAERRYREAIDALKQVQALVPGHARAFDLAGTSYGRLRRFYEAEIEFRSAHERAPTEVSHAYNVAVAAFNQRKYDDALTFFRIAEGLAGPDSPIRSGRAAAEFAYYRGSAAEKSSLIPEALSQLTRAVDLDPDNPVYREKLGEILMNEGRNEEALAQFVAVRRALPKNAENHYHAGRCLEALGRSAEAIESLKEALRLGPWIWQAPLAIGRIAAREDRPAEAISYLLVAMEKNPLSHEACYQLGQIYRKRGDAEEAKRWVDRYVELKRKAEAAEEESRRLIKAAGRDPSGIDSLVARAVLLLEHARFDEAEEVFLAVLGKQPFHKLSILNLASLLARKGSYLDASLELRKILDVVHGDPQANEIMGQIHVALQRHADAIPHLEIVAGSEATNPRVHAMLAQCYGATGDAARARHHAAEARRLAGQPPPESAPVR